MSAGQCRWWCIITSLYPVLSVLKLVALYILSKVVRFQHGKLFLVFMACFIIVIAMRSVSGGQTSAIIHEILNTAELIIMYPLGVLITAFKFKYLHSMSPSHAMGGPTLFSIPNTCAVCSHSVLSAPVQSIDPYETCDNRLQKLPLQSRKICYQKH